MRNGVSACTIILLLIFSVNNTKLLSQNDWDDKITLNLKRRPLQNALSEIRNQTNISLIYNSDIIKEKLVTCNINSSVENVIAEVLKESGLAYKKFDNSSVVIFKSKPLKKKYKAMVKESIESKSENLNNPFLSKPTLLSKTDFKYPAEAINKRLEGKVLINILINKKGDVTKATVEKSSGHKILDTSAINNAKKLKYLPAEIDGKYSGIWTTLVVKYNFN